MVKESYRLSAVASQFTKLGAQVEALEDGFIVNGTGEVNFTGDLLDSFGDHRIAMTLAVTSLITVREILIASIYLSRVFTGF